MNWEFLIISTIVILSWIGIALMFSWMGFGKEDREILEEFNKKNKL